jgi:hypothetical protein
MLFDDTAPGKEVVYVGLLWTENVGKEGVLAVSKYLADVCLELVL